jgi:hypothetical protein
MKGAKMFALNNGLVSNLKNVVDFFWALPGQRGRTLGSAKSILGGDKNQRVAPKVGSAFSATEILVSGTLGTGQLRTSVKGCFVRENFTLGLLHTLKLLTEE